MGEAGGGRNLGGDVENFEIVDVDGCVLYSASKYSDMGLLNKSSLSSSRKRVCKGGEARNSSSLSRGNKAVMTVNQDRGIAPVVYDHRRNISFLSKFWVVSFFFFFSSFAAMVAAVSDAVKLMRNERSRLSCMEGCKIVCTLGK